MKLKQTILSIAVAFLSIGAVATSVDSSKYQEVEKLQVKQEKKMKKAIASEFITPEDAVKLKNNIDEFAKAEKIESRKALLKMIDKEKADIKKVEKSLVKNEADTAKKELAELHNSFEKLEVQSAEAFVFKEDEQEVKTLKKEIDKLPKDIKKVQPIRAVSIKVSELSAKIKKNQTEAKKATETLKELNQASEELSDKEYLGLADKETLEKDREKNNQLIKNADSIATIEAREKESKELIEKLTKKSDETEKDFKANEEKARNLLKSMEKLIKEGELNSEEVTELNKQVKTLSDSLDLKEYKPGDLEKNYASQKESYDKYEKNSSERLEARKKKEKEEAAAKEKEKQEKAKQDAAKKAKAEMDTVTIHSDTWTKAPAGKRYLDRESQLTYKQVKEPKNFELISEEEATKYKPGHGNGSAKQ